MSRHDDEGSLVAWLVLFSLCLFAALGLVIDGGEHLSAMSQATAITEQAARTGAGAVSVDGLRQGADSLDAARAVAAAEAALARSGHPGTAWIQGGEVCTHVEYQRPTVMLGLVGIESTTISATSCAADLAGVTQPGG